MADKRIPWGKQKETLCKSAALNLLQLEGRASQLCFPVLYECQYLSKQKESEFYILCEQKRKIRELGVRRPASSPG